MVDDTNPQEKEYSTVLANLALMRAELDNLTENQRAQTESLIASFKAIYALAQLVEIIQQRGI